MLKLLRSYMMPMAMTIGLIFYKQVAILAFLTPFLIGIMLFFTYCNIDFKSLRFTKFHFALIAIQLLGSALAYFILLPFNAILAQGAMICILAPTATSAPVITGMLGGNVESLASYSLFCNLVVAFIAPLWFAFAGNVDADSFWHAVLIICQKVFVLLLLPFVLAYILSKFLPRAHAVIKKWKTISFYLWSFALIIITGKTVLFVVDQSTTSYWAEIVLAVAALITCISQFLVGRSIGSKLDNKISGGQGLGQKNTILAIWMAQTYLNPVASVAPGAYILWQNIVNSYQVWKKERSTD